MSVSADSIRRMRWAGAIAAAVGLLVAGALSGCTPSTPVAAAPSATRADAAVTPSPSAAGPLTCEDVVPSEEIVRALAAGQPAGDWVVVPTSTAAGSITGEKAVQGAGGLSCSWSAGPPDAEAGAAVLSVAILPDAAEQWTAQLYGDGPTDDRRTFAGVSAAASCGDPGCGASAAVGTSWVRVDLATGSREGGESAFAKETDDEVFADLGPAVESAFRAVQEADPAALRFPDHLPDGPVDCPNYLTKADLAGALEVPDVEIDADFLPDPDLESISGAAQQRVGTSVCIVEDPQYDIPTELASVTVAPEQSWAVDEIASDPLQQGDLRPAELDGLVSGEQALSDCDDSGNPCSVVFALGTTAIQVEASAGAVRVAEAILAAAR